MISKRDSGRPGGAPMELPPDWVYTIYLGEDTTGVVFAQVISMNQTDVIVQQGTSTLRLGSAYYGQEVWYYNLNALGSAGIGSAANITVTSVATSSPVTLSSSVGNGSNLTPQFTNASDVGPWSDTAKQVPTGDVSYVFEGNPATPVDSTAFIEFLEAAQNPTALLGVQWYLTGVSTQPVGAVLNPGSATGITYKLSAAPTSDFWAAISIWPS
ncbi:MAG: hypothetical protein IPK82_04445 [Polyangiaceae bacterium]|nr:hypothetical protein [Polyangiaceae bacterium]